MPAVTAVVVTGVGWEAHDEDVVHEETAVLECADLLLSPIELEVTIGKLVELVGLEELLADSLPLPRPGDSFSSGWRNTDRTSSQDNAR